jgi:hypothetical protein
MFSSNDVVEADTISWIVVISSIMFFVFAVALLCIEIASGMRRVHRCVVFFVAEPNVFVLVV